VAVGDINNDGLEDLYFTSNQYSNKLYLNQGNFVFSDITNDARVSDEDGWSTGASMIDINNDGWLDIYVCKSGSLRDPQLRRNKLYVNQKDNTFNEEASKYGLDQHGFSTQSYWADFENNIVINPELQKRLSQEDSDHLFRNDNGVFTNVSQQAGVANKAWGLSASIGDFNNDNWPDIYVANDFLEPDFLYINNQDGTFTDASQTYFNHISTNSMGSDFADINNDMLPDLVVLDMMAADRVRSKENMASMSTENFNTMVSSGYHHQYMSNVLQLNNGREAFSEIGQLSGIAKTDWSWAPLVADFDNDGYNDVFVTNGIENDLSNQDFRNQMRRNIMNRKKVSLEEAIGMMPSTKLANYMFINNADYTFRDESDNFGFDAKINSNGAAYADLDNDGDLDLVLNNQSDKASVYRNNSVSNYLSVELKGPEQNKNALGAKVEVYAGGISQIKEVYLSRGYQSSVGNTLIFGLGTIETADSLKVIWPDGKIQELSAVETHSSLEFDYVNAEFHEQEEPQDRSVFNNIDPASLGIGYKHHSVKFNDYGVQLLLPQKQSTVDNALAVADVNQDGLEDIFIGNTMGYSGQLYIQDSSGRFSLSNREVFEADKDYNDNKALFFDADGDGDRDLYVASGNYNQPKQSTLLQDRLYINDGKGNFSKMKLPQMLTVTKAVTAGDMDGDGDLDLFVGGRVIPGRFPDTPESYLLENRNGNFVNVTSSSPGLNNAGLINDAVFSDYDLDGDNDLILAGEWMPVTVFNNDNGEFHKADMPSDLIKGWFQTIKALDLDNDGDQDYLVGNYGANNKFHPSPETPLHIYANHFDENDSYDLALGKASENGLFPVRGKECSSQQTPFLHAKIPTFKEFANSTMVDVYGHDNIDNAFHLEVTSFSSYYIENNGNGDLEFKELPIEAQFGPTLAFETIDVNQDGRLEILGVGNIYDAEVETIRYDASRGYVLNTDAQDDFSVFKELQGYTSGRACPF
jgi:hypothetical protein